MSVPEFNQQGKVVRLPGETRGIVVPSTGEKKATVSVYNYAIHSTQQPVLRYLEKVITSNIFAGSQFLRRLLETLVTKVLRAEEHEIKEYYLAIEVFGRRDFDPRIDTIVRVQARRLRLKLQEYYRTEGQYDAVRIDIPKGSYVPIISHLPAGSITPADEASVSGDRFRIAVLPFLDLSTADVADQTFADAVTENLINALSLAGYFDVMVATSVFIFKQRSRDIRIIGKRLNIDVILEGSIQRSGKLLRVNARLANASTGLILWANTLDIKAQDRIAAQEQLASAIVPRIRDRLSGVFAKSA